MDKYPYGTFGPEHLKKMKLGIEQFNDQLYWECHESLEDIWIEDKQDAARNVYWAVIQVAAACIHYRDDNIVGARGMIAKAKEKFKRCRDQHILTDLAFKFLDWEELEKTVFAIKDKDPALEEFEPLYNFRFKNYPDNLSP